MIVLLKGEATKGGFELPEGVVGTLLALVATLGATVVRVIGRLRRTQLEHFRLINNVRSYFLEQDYALWNIVQLSTTTLPKPNRKSGSYAWVLTIIFLSSYFAAFSFYLFVFKVWIWLSALTATILTYALFMLLVFLLDWFYFRSALLPPPHTYSDVNDPRVAK